jgi:hypothetical protein
LVSVFFAAGAFSSLEEPGFMKPLGLLDEGADVFAFVEPVGLATTLGAAVIGRAGTFVVIGSGGFTKPPASPALCATPCHCPAATHAHRIKTGLFIMSCSRRRYPRGRKANLLFLG